MWCMWNYLSSYEAEEQTPGGYQVQILSIKNINIAYSFFTVVISPGQRWGLVNKHRCHLLINLMTCFSAPVLPHCSTYVSYPPPCSAVVLQCCSVAVLQCCIAAYLCCCSVLLIPISVSGLRHPRNYKNRAHPRNSNSRVDPIFSISREWGVYIMMPPAHAPKLHCISLPHCTALHYQTAPQRTSTLHYTHYHT